MADIEFDVWDRNQRLRVFIITLRLLRLWLLWGDVARPFMRGWRAADDNLIPGDTTCAVNEEVFQ